MTFNEWLNEIEDFSTRYERLVCDVYNGGGMDLRGWLEAAYNAGHEAGILSAYDEAYYMGLSEGYQEGYKAAMEEIERNKEYDS